MEQVLNFLANLQVIEPYPQLLNEEVVLHEKIPVEENELSILSFNTPTKGELIIHEWRYRRNGIFQLLKHYNSK